MRIEERSCTSQHTLEDAACSTPSFKAAPNSFVVSRSNHTTVSSSDMSPFFEAFDHVADENAWMKKNKGVVADLDSLHMTPAVEVGLLSFDCIRGLSKDRYKQEIQNLRRQKDPTVKEKDELEDMSADLSEEDMRQIADEVKRMEDIEDLVHIMDGAAPNLSALVGNVVAARLTKAAGGLGVLANMPSVNVRLLGHFVKNSETSARRVTYLENTELFSSTPPELRKHCLQLLAAKSSLAARLDKNGQDPTGSSGRKLRQMLVTKLKQLEK